MSETFSQLFSFRSLGVPGLTLEKALLSMIFAFIIGQFTGWIYIYTHSGLSYSRSFVQSIILLTTIVALAMLVIGNNVIVAFGLIGALAVIRFRNILKDTRDTSFIFFALIAGIACGTYRYKLAILGTVIFTVILLYLHLTSFGGRRLMDGFLQFHIKSSNGDLLSIQTFLGKYCRNVKLMSQRIYQEGIQEVAYNLSIKDPALAAEMIAALQETQGVSDVNFIIHEEHVEV
ncbi:DUF4956 domain-containing protein [Candidatus Sumerlaeota bacterium]|nr:DUF4956 domain-containing protein [Candidatus Sumerlaeota bacterium]